MITQMLTNILLTAILLITAAILAGLLFAFLKIRAVAHSAVEFCTPPSENVPSQLATVVDSASQMVGRSVVAQVKTFLMGSRSGEVRSANAEVGAGIDKTPLGGLVGMLPKSVRSSLIKNPQLLDYALDLMSKKGPRGSGGGGNGVTASAPKFKL